MTKDLQMRIADTATLLSFVVVLACSASAGSLSDSKTDSSALPFTSIHFAGCRQNPDSRYDRDEVIGKFATSLDDAFPEYDSFDKYRKDLFIQDITDVSNSYRVPTTTCINFIEGHVYYFAPISFEKAAPHIAFLEDGDIKVFRNIGCLNGGDGLSEVVKYLETHLKSSSEKKDVLTRVANYRRYGFHMIFDAPNEYCSSYDSLASSDSAGEEKRTVAGKEKFAETVRSSIRKEKQKFYPGFFVERGQAVGFFIYDLTDPSRKQTSLLENITIVEGHVYHFAAIDLPWSYSFIAVAGKNDDDTKIFRAINCKGRGDKLSDVLDYLSANLPDTNNKKDILDRVTSYRSYGTYTSFDGRSEPQCRDYNGARP